MMNSFEWDLSDQTCSFVKCFFSFISLSLSLSISSEAERDFKLTHKALRSKDSVDSKGDFLSFAFLFGRLLSVLIVPFV